VDPMLRIARDGAQDGLRLGIPNAGTEERTHGQGAVVAPAQ
jgi:hypothetical protein